MTPDRSFRRPCGTIDTGNSHRPLAQRKIAEMVEQRYREQAQWEGGAVVDANDPLGLLSAQAVKAHLQGDSECGRGAVRGSRGWARCRWPSKWWWRWRVDMVVVGVASSAVAVVVTAGGKGGASERQWRG